MRERTGEGAIDHKGKEEWRVEGEMSEEYEVKRKRVQGVKEEVWGGSGGGEQIKVKHLVKTTL